MPPPWYAPFTDWSDLIKKKVCRFVLQRYLGQFLEEKLSLDQLNVDFYNGTGTVYDVTLYCQALNELCEGQGWGIEVTGGHIGSVSVNIPYEALLKKDSFIEVSNLTVALRPKARVSDGTSMLESMWSSMSSSMQLAQECLEKESGDTAAASQPNAIDGLEKFAQMIDNVLNRIKAKLINTEIRVEYLPPESECGVSFIIKIENIEYQNEAGNDPPDKENTDDNNKKQKSFFISTHANHHIIMEGITFYTEEFRIHNPNMKQKVNESALNSSKNMTDSLIASEQFLSAISNLPETTADLYSNQFKCDNNEQQENEEDDDSSECYRSGEIIIGKLSSQQEIRVTMKLADNIPGPNVELEMSFGALTLFLSPRQLHLLLLLSDILISGSEVPPPKTSPTSNKNAHKCDSATSEFDFKQDFSNMSGGIGLNQGWSDPIRQFTTQDHDIFEHGISESVMSSNSSMTSSINSSASHSTTSRTTNASRRRGIDPDANADISHFNVRIACLAVVLMHEDILVECSQFHGNESPLSECSVQTLQMKADRFFRSIENMGIGIGANDILKVANFLDNGCDHNHLRLIAAPLIFEGEEQRNARGNLLRFSLSIARADFREILSDASVPLLEFYREKNSNALPKRPEITINFRQIHHTLKGSSGKRFSAPKMEVNVSLTPLLTEFDISILDRLSALIYQSPFVTAEQLARKNFDSVSPQHQMRSEPKTEIKIDSCCVDFRMRFPIPDLRPIHDPQRIPWWQRSVRPDYILIKLQQMRMNISLIPLIFDMSANEINLFYYESDCKMENVNIGKSVMLENVGSKFSAPSVEYPRIVIEIPSEKVLQNVQETIYKTDRSGNRKGGSADDTDSDPTSGESIGVTTGKQKEDTPFSSKRICRESDTPHSKQAADDPETLIIPGDNTEMKAFCDNAMKLSKLQIKVELPVVSLQLKSKHLYEVIYNRISTDLLLWEPSAPAATGAASMASSSKTIFNQPESSLLNVGMMDSLYVPFSMCKSGIQFESSSSATNSESESDSDGIFYSVYDKNAKSKRFPVVDVVVDRTNTISFQLNIGQGMVSMFAPVRDSQNHVIPGQLGEFVIKGSSAYIFSVNGFHGNSNLGYLCIQAKSAELYHCGLIPIPSPNPPLRVINSVLPTHMCSTFYPTPKNLTLNEASGYPNRDMISLAIQIKAVPEQSVKRIRVSAGIQLATLKHNSSLPQHSWLTQIMDMFDVLDYPVQGYTPFGVVTEMHLHLWDCAIDYRPLYFPYRAVITVGSFMISSNITTASSGCTLRFVAEDATLSLAPQTAPGGDQKHREDNKVTSLPSSDLICVIELGLFEISLRLNEKVTPSFPKFDLRMAINGVHIRTCADSGQALAQLIGYLAAEGDLLVQDDISSEISEESLCLPTENELLLPVKSGQMNVPEVTPKQQQRVNSLMADAMEESLLIQTSKMKEDSIIADGEGVEVFFFPDENVQNKTIKKSSNLVSDNSNKRRFASDEDSISIDEASSVPSSYQDDDTFMKQRQFDENTEDTVSVNTEMNELLNFECSVMGIKTEDDEECLDALPQVTMDLGDITKIEINPKIEKNITRKISSDTDEEFCFIAEEEKPQCGLNPEVPVSEDPIRIVDNHFSVPMGKPDLLKAPKDFPMAVMRYTLCEMSLTWHLYGGKDFMTEEMRKKSKSKKSDPHFIHLPMSEAYKSGVSYSKGSPNVTFGQTPAQKLSWKVRGGDDRKHDVLMQIVINKVRFSHETYPANTEQASRQVLLISELEIIDRVAVSSINKFLYRPRSTVHQPKQGNQHMVVIKALHLRPDPALTTQECCLRISLLPLRLNIDQDSLLFLVNYFNELGGGVSLNEGSTGNAQSGQRAQNTLPHQPPVMMVELPEAAQELQARKMVSENLMLLIEEEEKNKETSDASSDMSDNTPIYFRNIVFSPDVPIRLDYHGKRVELSHGPLAGLLMGLGQLQCSEITLKKISYRHGLLGVDRLLNFLLQEWLQDIKKKQLPKILGGVGPMYSLVQLFQGIWDLFWLPIEQYQKDGRIVRGLQRGAQSFTARTALAALEITTRIIHLLQITAETAYDMVSPGPSVRRGRGIRKGKRKRLHPPQDIREGMTNAYQIVKEGIGDTAMTLVELTALEHDQKGYTGAVGAVMRQIPPIVVQPIVLAAQATSNVLGGVRNQLVPDARAEAKEKYKDDDE